MIDITKFKPLGKGISIESPAVMRVSWQRVSFNKGAITALGSPSHVRFLYDAKSHAFVVVAEPEAGKDTFPFATVSRSRLVPFTRRNLRLICDEVFGKTEADYPYSVEGYKDTTANGKVALVFKNDEGRK